MTKPKYSREDALNPEQFSVLVTFCERSKHRIIDLFSVMVMGILGLRIGETVHLHRNWVDFTNKVITIPKHFPCSCPYCILAMSHMVKRKDVSLDDVEKVFWKPKTSAGARTIFFGFNHEVERIIIEFFDHYEKIPIGADALRYHIKILGDKAGLKNLHPHCLRATAATKFAYDGVNVQALQTIMGWDDIEIAQHYLATSGVMGQREIERVYGNGDRQGLFFHDSNLTFYATHFGEQVLTRKKQRDDEAWLRSIFFPKEVKGPKQAGLFVV